MKSTLKTSNIEKCTNFLCNKSKIAQKINSIKNIHIIKLVQNAFLRKKTF